MQVNLLLEVQPDCEEAKITPVMLHFKDQHPVQQNLGSFVVQYSRLQDFLHGMTILLARPLAEWPTSVNSDRVSLGLWRGWKVDAADVRQEEPITSYQRTGCNAAKVLGVPEEERYPDLLIILRLAYMACMP